MASMPPPQAPPQAPPPGGGGGGMPQLPPQILAKVMELVKQGIPMQQAIQQVVTQMKMGMAGGGGKPPMRALMPSPMGPRRPPIGR